MDFFRSILSDDPDPEINPQPKSDLDQNHPDTQIDETDDDPSSTINSSDDSSSSISGTTTVGGGGAWSFGDLVKTLTTKSESVFETYRKDLKEFGTGLRKESDLFREVATRAVKELPASIDVDGVLKSTVDIIAQGKEALLAGSDIDDVDDSSSSGKDNLMRGYSRFDVQLNIIRSDVRGFMEDPDDVEEYDKWKVGFLVGDKKEEIEKLVGEGGELEGVYGKVVPGEVDDATFWFRYFYKVWKLEQQEVMRAKLVKRSLSVDDDEELSWDVDDDDEDEVEEVEEEKQVQRQQSSKKQEGEEVRGNTLKSRDDEDVRKKEVVDDEVKAPSDKIVEDDKEMTANVVSVDKNNVEEPKVIVEKAELVPKVDEKVEVKVDSGEVKESDGSVKAKEPSSQEDEDLEWDEIEDLGKPDDKDVSHGDETSKAELRKRLSTAADEDEEDLSWDIEDDDEPVKQGNK